MKYDGMRGERNHNYKHGYDGTPTYKSWQSMKDRCLNPNATSYPIYGAKGIMICERWMVFENFLADMGERPEGTSLDRKDSNGHYEPGNCRWATAIEQSRNRKSTKLNTDKVKEIKLLLVDKTLKEVAEIFNVGLSTIQDINKGRTWRDI